MSELGVFLEAFHFIRPLWLLLLPVLATVWWLARSAHLDREAPDEEIAPHLRAALTVGGEARRRRGTRASGPEEGPTRQTPAAHPRLLPSRLSLYPHRP